MFHIDWLLQLFPRNKKAVPVFVILLLSLTTLGATILTFTAPSPPRRNIVMFVVSLVVGVPTAAYYYFLQSKPKAGYSDIDTLDHYYKSEADKPVITVISTSQPLRPLKGREK